MTRGRVVKATEHGTYGFAYKNKCGCELCALARSRYRKAREYDIFTGRTRQVDAEPVREHLFLLCQHGGTPNNIARATGGAVVKEQIKRILYGNPQTGKEVKTVYRRTAQLLLAVQPEKVADHEAWTHPLGTRRRLQALHAMGHGKVEVANELGIHWSNLYEYTYRERLTVATAQRVREVYDRLCMVQGDNEVIRWRARRLGWLPPLAWEDHTIDDPLAEPDLEAIKCVVEPCPRSIKKPGMLCRYHYRVLCQANAFETPRSYREAVLALNSVQIHERDMVLEDLRELREMGLSAAEAAERLGRKPSYIAKLWKEAS